jgi:uncharacterized iron-regulated membrane protein
MRKTLDLIHRWTGGLTGLLLAVLGLSGAILVHESAWIMLPHADDPQVQDVSHLSATVTRLMADDAARPDSILFASKDFGLHRLRFGTEAGAYTDQAGNLITRWDSKWDRVELWLFDLHHHLWAGEAGETVAGFLGLIGLGFVVTGIYLWWPLRKTFHFRAWPARMSRPAIVRQHRDLGIVLAPLLFLSMLTGSMMTLRPVATFVLSPWSSRAEMDAATAKPAIQGGTLAQNLDWAALLNTARQQFPTAEIRLLTLPRKPGDLISMRMKQPDEWLPNGRTLLWFAPEDGRLIDTRDALKMPPGSRINHLVYPLHAAKVGGLFYRIVMTASGLGLATLGTFAVWAFWFRRQRAPARAPLQGTIPAR